MVLCLFSFYWANKIFFAYVWKMYIFDWNLILILLIVFLVICIVQLVIGALLQLYFIV